MTDVHCKGEKFLAFLSSFVSFLKDFFDKFLYSLGISFQTLTPTREKAFFLHFEPRVLNAKEL